MPPEIDIALDEVSEKRSKKIAKDGGQEESQLAKLAAPILKENFKFDPVSLDFWAANGDIWTICKDIDFSRAVFMVLDKVIPEGFSNSRLRGVKEILKLLLDITHDAPSQNLLPMLNGVFDVGSRTLRPYAKSDFFTWQLPYEFNEDARCPNFLEFIDQATGEDLPKILRIQAIINCLITRKKVQRFLELIGPGGTGKSTFVTLLKHLVGEENTASTDLENLEKNRFETAVLYQKRLAIISDADKWGGSVPVLKAATGGDPLRYELKNKQQNGSFVYDGLIVVAANAAIQTTDYTSGLSRRRLPMRFDNKISDAAKLAADRHGGIDAILKRECDGILNWALSMPDAEVFDAVQILGIDLTPEGRRHLVETNRLAGWMDDCLVIDPSAKHFIGHRKETDEAESKLYPSYVAWCSENAVNPIKLQNFSESFLQLCESLDIAIERLPKSNKGRAIKGVAIRASAPVHYAKFVTPVTNEEVELEA